MNERFDPLMIADEPYYRSIGNEVDLFGAAMTRGLPMILKGPTGCGKTRFIEYMAWRMGLPLVTMACNEDMTASDLVGRWLLDAGGTVWHDGPLTKTVRNGGICYLDEFVEARQDTSVVIHPLTDDRRILPLDKRGEVVQAHPDFRLVVSYNPGYQSVAKDMKPSTRQRFGAIEFGFPPSETEAEIVGHESGVSEEMAQRLVAVANQSRELRGRGLDEGISTRMLIHAGALIVEGIAIHDACTLAMTAPLTDDGNLQAALHGFVEAQFGPR